MELRLNNTLDFVRFPVRPKAASSEHKPCCRACIDFTSSRSFHGPAHGDEDEPLGETVCHSGYICTGSRRYASIRAI